MAEAPVFPCANCGVPLAIDPTAASGACTYCRATTAIPDAVREAARAYNRQIREHGERLTFAQRLMGGDPADRLFNVFFVAIGVLCAVFAVVEMGPGLFGLDPDIEQYATWGFVGAIGLAILAMFAAIPFVIRRLVADEDAIVVPVWSGFVLASCAHCGAPVRFVVGETETSCAHCHRAVQASQAHQRAVTTMAAQQADLTQARASRHRDPLDRGVDILASVLIGGFELALLALWPAPGAILIYIGVSLFDPYAQGVLGELLMVISVGLMIAGALFIAALILVARALHKRSPGERLRRALQTMQAATHGRLRSGVPAIIEWLDAHWAAVVPTPVTTTENSADGKSITRWSLDFSFAGRAALVVAAVSPHVDRIDVFLSAYTAPVTVPTTAAEDASRARVHEEVRGAGFELVRSVAGVHLTRLKGDPALLTAQGVQWLLQRATALAAA
jgi:hypothetical protein